jgi:enoyl-CoA hydratase
MNESLYALHPTVKFSTLLYQVKDKICFITLNRVERFNAINSVMPLEIREAINNANADPQVHVIIMSGNGKGFCSGYDLIEYAESKGPNPGSQEMPWDPLLDYQLMSRNTECFMAIFRSLKPVICKVHGFAIAGGSDICLCADFVIMEENAKIGYPPARVWGCPTTFMWIYRLGMEKAKRMLFTGDIITGTEAKAMGLVLDAVPAAKLDETVMQLARRMTSMPKNQLMMQKLVINKTVENLGINFTQTLATLMDGIARHTPEGVAFKKRCEEVGFKTAVLERDSGNPILTTFSKL